MNLPEQIKSLQETMSRLEHRILELEKKLSTMLLILGEDI